MKLYHGTSGETARLVTERGLLPRDDLEPGAGNWEKCPSRGDLIYLTDAYAPYFAAYASEAGEPWGLIEVETDLLDGVGDMLPDEDYLEQASRKRHAKSHPPRGLSMEERTQWFRDRLAKFAHYWEQSLEGLGNCAFRGPIPPCAITKIVIFDPYKNHPLLGNKSLQPQVHLWNYKFMGGIYRALTRWILGYEVSSRELDPFIDLILQKPPPGFEKYVSKLEAELADRSCLEFLKS